MPEKKSDNFVIIDTSIWIEYFRGRNPLLVRQVELFIDQRNIRNISLITAELIRGCLNLKEVNRIRYTIEAIPCYSIEDPTWEKIALFAFGLARKGLTTSLIDASIAYLAIDTGNSLWTKDKDFQRIAARSSLRLWV